MIRLLAFAVVFPALATATFYAVNYSLTGAAQDGGGGPVVMYLIFIAPGLLVAVIDWLAAKSSIPAVVTTTLLSYGLTVLMMGWALGFRKDAMALGLICAIPAGMCSWMSRGNHGTAQASSTATPT